MILSERDWGATPLMGFAWVVGPVVDGMVEARGQGETLEAAMENALRAEGDERLRLRIKRLESRRKRFDTLLRSARRSLSTHERLARAAQKVAV